MKFAKIFIISLTFSFLITITFQHKIELETYEYSNDELPPNSALWKHTMNLARTPHNLTELKICLMKSFIHDKSSFPIFYLAKFTLFGYPKLVPPSNQISSHYCDDFKIKNGKDFKKLEKMMKENPLNNFKTNVSLSFTYFLTAHQFGHEDAPGYLYFLLEQNLIYDNFLGSIDPVMPSDDFMLNLLTVGANRGSHLAKLLILADTLFCLKSKNDSTLNSKFRKQLKPSFQEFLTGSYLKRSCYECSEILTVALQAGTEALTYLQKIGGQRPSLPSFESTPIEAHESEETTTITEENYSDEYYLLKSSAEQGNDAAQETLGEMYLLGSPNHGVPRDIPQAFDFFQLGAENGNFRSLYNLGLMHANGIGVEVNGTKAKENFHQAIELGNEEAYSGLAILYLHGIGVKKNITKAVEYLEKAAKNGNAEAETNLAALYLDELNNEQKAVFYFQKAAEKKQLSSMFNLGILYMRGIAINATCEQILQNILEVCLTVDKLKLGEKALTNYKKGYYERSLLLSSLGALVGSSYHSKNLDFLLKHPNPKAEVCKYNDAVLCRSIYYYKHFILFDEVDCGLKLADLLYYGSKNLQKNYELSVLLYDKLAENSPEAAFSLSFMYENGYGVEKNLDHSRKILEILREMAWEQKISFENYWPALIAIGKLKFIFFWNKLSSLF